MIREVFADTGFWIAVANPSDELHQRANETYANLTPLKIITTEMVLVEFLNSMGKQQYIRKIATDMIVRLRNNPNVEIVPQTSRQFRAAFSRYASRMDQRWGLTDCASFRVMEDRKIREALAYDRDFAQAGFVALLRDD